MGGSLTRREEVRLLSAQSNFQPFDREERPHMSCEDLGRVVNGFNSNVLTPRGVSEAKISVLFALVSKIKPNAFSYRLLGYLRGKGGFKGHGNVGTLNEMMQQLLEFGQVA